MGYAEDFAKVKQFGLLYDNCMKAGANYDDDKNETGYIFVCEAFSEMKRILRDDKGFSSDILSDLSCRNYEMYSIYKTDAEGIKTKNPFYALLEEVRKFADYYVKGMSVNAIAEVNAGTYDSAFDRMNRNSADTIWAVGLIAVILLIGIVLLLFSTSNKYDYFFPGGLCAVILGIVLIVIRANVHRD